MCLLNSNYVKAWLTIPEIQGCTKQTRLPLSSGVNQVINKKPNKKDTADCAKCYYGNK